MWEPATIRLGPNKAVRDDHNEHTVVQRTDPLLGGVVANRFKIREKIAAGGFGAIYRAQHIASGHEVAIKVLHPQLAADPNVIARFRREGATLSKLRAPHTVTTYEFGEAPDGMLYIVMELLRGMSLHERLRERGMLPWREALQIARAICISLAEAHALGIVHRDLKPANIHLETRGDHDYVKVLDFGIAKIKRGATTDEQPELTNAGQMIGTVDYMSPEQILGGQPDGRSDIFTLGILLFEMIAGRRPFAESATPTSMLAALLTQTAPRLSQFSPVPQSLDALVAKCLLREANERFASVEELADEMDRILMSSSDDGATRLIAVGLHTQKWEDEEATLMADAAMERSGRGPNTLESVVPPAPRHTPTPQLGTPVPQRKNSPTSPPPRQAPAAMPRQQRSTAPPPMNVRQQPSTTPPPMNARQQPSMTPPAMALRPRPATPEPMPAQRQPTPPPMQRMTPQHRQHPPTPFPAYPYQPDANNPPTPPPQFQQQPQPYPQWQQPVINPSAANIPVDNSGWNVPMAGRPSQPDPSGWRQSQSLIPPVAPSFGQPERAAFPPTPQPTKTYDPNKDAAVGRIIWIVAIVIVIALGFAIYKVLT